MPSYCKYCGTKLEDGAGCNCQEAVAERAAAPQIVAPQQPLAPVQPVTPPVQEAQAQQVYQQVPAQGQAGSPQPNANVEAAKSIMKEVKGVVASLSKDPSAAAQTSNQMSMGASLALLGVQVVSLMILVGTIVGKILSEIKKAMGFWGAAMDQIKAPASLYVYSIITGLVYVGLLFVALLVVGKLFKSTLDNKSLLSSMAVSSIPISASYLAISVLVFVLGLGASFMTYLVMAISVFATIMSYFLLEISMNRLVPVKTNNMLIIATAYAVHIIVFMIVFGGILNSFVEGLLPMGAGMGELFDLFSYIY